ncbi:MAG TPA: hypothetical protein VJZ78_04695 [Anaerolineales bacterium]|nr:hypothetical protein [Anaerolineales bacterium]
MKNRSRLIGLIIFAVVLSGLTGCSQLAQTPENPVILDRNLKIPTDAVKVLPETDIAPPVTISSEYSQPVPVPGLVNSAGGEDSPFILPDGKTLYFWFTPDVSKPAQAQILDGVTGIYVSNLVGGAWGKPARVILQDSGKLAGDGCEFVMGDTIWFCSAREGYEGMNWFKAEFLNGSWQKWQLVEFDPSYEVGELHISSDGKDLYFASTRPGGMGNMDIWVSHWLDGRWNEPGNIMEVNTQDNEGWPALNPAGDELWFLRNFGIWRSKLIDGIWSTPELMISSLAGEPSIDADGNVYFTHHFFKDNVMLEADIYVANKK